MQLSWKHYLVNMVAEPDTNDMTTKMERMEKNFEDMDFITKGIKEDIEDLHKKAKDMEMIKEDFGDKLAKRLGDIEVTGDQRYGIQENNIKNIIDGATAKFNELEQDLKKMTRTSRTRSRAPKTSSMIPARIC